MIGYKWVFVATFGATAIAVGCGGDDEGGTTGSGASGTGTGTGGSGTGTQTGTGGSGTGTATGTGGSGGGTGGGGTGGGGMGPGNDWSCLGTLNAPSYKNGPSLTGTYTVTDLLDGMPIDGATINICDATDTDCANPADTGTTDASGMVTLSAPQNARHYFEFDATDYPTHLVYSNGPPQMANWSYNSTPLDDAGLDQLVALLGETPDASRGHIGLNIQDCNGALASGVSVTLDTADGQTVYGYFAANGFPNSSLTETSADGRVGIANVPVGAFVVTATVVATNEVITTRSGYVRAGAITYPAPMTPTPEASSN